MKNVKLKMENDPVATARGTDTALLNHRIASKLDHRVTLFEFGKLGSFAPANFLIVFRRIAPAREMKETNLPVLGIHQPSFPTTRFHFGQLVLNRDRRSSFETKADRFIGVDIFGKTTVLLVAR